VIVEVPAMLPRTQWITIAVVSLCAVCAIYYLVPVASPYLRSSVPQFIVLVGPNGAGKSTLVRALLRDHPCQLRTVSRIYTRPARADEVDCDAHRFLSMKQFDELARKGQMIVMDTHLMVTGNGTMLPARSGVDLSTIDTSNRERFLLDFHAKHLVAWRDTKYFDKTVIICIHPPNLGVLKTRLLKRHSTEPQVADAYMHNVKQELAYLSQRQLCQHTVVNNQVPETLAGVKHIIGLHRHTTNTNCCDSQ